MLFFDIFFEKDPHLAVVENINYFSALNILVNTTLKNSYSQGLNEKLKLVGGPMKVFSKKLLGHEICNIRLIMSSFLDKNLQLLFTLHKKGRTS